MGLNPNHNVRLILIKSTKSLHMETILSWGSPIGIGILMAGIGVFFWGLKQLIK